MIWRGVGFEKGLGEGKLGPNIEELDFFWALVRVERRTRKRPFKVSLRCLSTAL